MPTDVTGDAASDIGSSVDAGDDPGCACHADIDRNTRKNAGFPDDGYR